jgi:hypothetical protein
MRSFYFAFNGVLIPVIKRPLERINGFVCLIKTITHHFERIPKWIDDSGEIAPRVLAGEIEISAALYYPLAIRKKVFLDGISKYRESRRDAGQSITLALRLSDYYQVYAYTTASSGHTKIVVVGLQKTHHVLVKMIAFVPVIHRDQNYGV